VAPSREPCRRTAARGRDPLRAVTSRPSSRPRRSSWASTSAGRARVPSAAPQHRHVLAAGRRSNHSRLGRRGALYPLTGRAGGVAALLVAVRAGRLDPSTRPPAPRHRGATRRRRDRHDRVRTDDLYESVRRAAPYTDLTRAQFDEVLDLSRTGSRPAAGGAPRPPRLGERRGPGQGAALAALTSGGPSPRSATIGGHRTDDTFIGTVTRLARESDAGDSSSRTHAWQIRRIEAGVVRYATAGAADRAVLDRRGAGRTPLSAEVSTLRATVDEYLRAATRRARRFVADTGGLQRRTAAMIVDYVAVGAATLGACPRSTSCPRTFFDERAACSSSCTPPTAADQPALGSPAQNSVARSTSSCRPPRTTTRGSLPRPAPQLPARDRARTEQRDGGGTLRQAILDSRCPRPVALNLNRR